jgi:hypothetical protein
MGPEAHMTALLAAVRTKLEARWPDVTFSVLPNVLHATMGQVFWIGDPGAPDVDEVEAVLAAAVAQLRQDVGLLRKVVVRRSPPLLQEAVNVLHAWRDGGVSTGEVVLPRGKVMDPAVHDPMKVELGQVSAQDRVTAQALVTASGLTDEDHFDHVSMNYLNPVRQVLGRVALELGDVLEIAQADYPQTGPRPDGRLA